MTYARAHLVDTENGGFYHCISRCVRRSWLCGRDSVSGRSFEHRRGWIESRLLELSELFAVELYGYAVMSNHYHVVVQVDPKRVGEWSDESVVRRWLRLCPGASAEHEARKRQALLEDAERVAELRVRLGSLSWFMRFVNEPIAREANREDRCTGRFWEGRFKSVALLDEAAVLACLAYVDLNPVRAEVTARAESGPYTSIRRRVGESEKASTPLASLDALGMTLPDYVALVRWTARVEQGGVAGPRGEAAQALSGMGQSPEAWLRQVRAHRFKYRAYGAAGRLRRYAEALGQSWIRGCRHGALAGT